MTIHITWIGLLAVIGGAVLAGFLLCVLYFLFMIWRWGR